MGHEGYEESRTDINDESIATDALGTRGTEDSEKESFVIGHQSRKWISDFKLHISDFRFQISEDRGEIICFSCQMKKFDFLSVG
jgi:hypothetical protein